MVYYICEPFRGKNDSTDFDIFYIIRTESVYFSFAVMYTNAKRCYFCCVRDCLSRTIHLWIVGWWFVVAFCVFCHAYSQNNVARRRCSHLQNRI